MSELKTFEDNQRLKLQLIEAKKFIKKQGNYIKESEVQADGYRAKLKIKKSEIRYLKSKL